MDKTSKQHLPDVDTLRTLRRTPQTFRALCNGILDRFCEKSFDVSVVLEEVARQYEHDKSFGDLLKRFYEAQGNYLLWKISSYSEERIDFNFDVNHPNFILARSYAAILKEMFQSNTLLFRVDLLRVRHAVYRAETVEGLEAVFSIMNEQNWGLLQRACLDAEAAICLGNKRHRSEDLWESAFELLHSFCSEKALLPSRLASFCYRWADTGLSSNSYSYYSLARKCFNYSDACKPFSL